jgi:hypothetical protein
LELSVDDGVPLIYKFKAAAAEVHNRDIDTILDLISRGRHASEYYEVHSEKRTAHHLELYRQSEHFGAYLFPLDAAHVGLDDNGIYHSEQELQRAAKSLSFRPIDLNHERLFTKDYRKHLPYPENQTLLMDYDPEKQAVVGWLELEECFGQILRGRQVAVSVETYYMDGAKGKGSVFSGITLLSQDVQPADRRARLVSSFYQPACP